MQAFIGASGILYCDGLYLLGRREMTDSSLPGQWCTPGGGIEPGESYDECIVREFKEETGLEVEVPNHFFPNFTSVQMRTSTSMPKDAFDGSPIKRTSLLVFRRVFIVGGNGPVALEGFDRVGSFKYEALDKLSVTEMTKAAILDHERFLTRLK
jgi:8-oxo-dGTP pyrophosphatase MutT (NUDIX family)